MISQNYINTTNLRNSVLKPPETARTFVHGQCMRFGSHARRTCTLCHRSAHEQV